MGESGLFFQREQGVSRQDMPIFVQTDFFTHWIQPWCLLSSWWAENSGAKRCPEMKVFIVVTHAGVGFCDAHTPVSKLNKLTNSSSWTWWDHLFVRSPMLCLGWRKLLENSFQRCNERLEVISHTGKRPGMSPVTVAPPPLPLAATPSHSSLVLTHEDVQIFQWIA